MAKKLIIVESPNKIHTISKIMGPGYTVLATAGHIMMIDSVGSYKMGVDTANDFKISYVVDPEKKDLVKKIKDAAKDADEIFICSDGDREGEKIADEIRDILKLHKKKLKRAVFNEITDKAVKTAIANPIPFDENMIQAAESRAALDRVVGYRLSPLAKSKLNCDSAGRVQSALLRLICEKEATIQKFKSSKYWEVFLDFKKGNSLLTAKLCEVSGKKVERLSDKTDADNILANCKADNYIVDDIKDKTKLVEPKLPMTTAAMQQIASTTLGLSPARSQAAAQHLFEKGYITYLRTDAVRFSDEFITEAKAYIEKNYAACYRGLNLPKNENENAQNAHESIRPTSLDNTPSKMSQLLEGDELKLYKMIFAYSLAALFKPAKVKDTDIFIKNGVYKFKISGRTIVFESFLQLYNDLDESKTLPDMKVGEKVNDKELYKVEKETQPPQRYSEAGLVKLMQETGIGRPSSYSGTIETLKKREYIKIEKKAVVATDKGMQLSKMLVDYFPDIINTKYTSNMETQLDEISDGKSTKIEMLSAFWKDFEPAVLKAAREINKDKPKPVQAGKLCPDCGKQLVIRVSKTGTKFLACSGFPKCKHTEAYIDPNEPKKEIIQCPECGDGHMVQRKSKKNEIFWGCSRWPKCNKTFNEQQMKEYLANLANVDNKDND